MTEAAKGAAETVAEPVVTLVETIPFWAIALAFLAGGAVVFVAMMAVSKAPESSQ